MPSMAKLIPTRAVLYPVILLVMGAFLAVAQAPGHISYNPGPGFPTNAFKSYYYGPEATREPQPAVQDPILDITYPLSLTDPNTIPTNDDDAPVLPQPIRNISQPEKHSYLQHTKKQISEIFEDSSQPSNCSKCTASLKVLQSLAQVAPKLTPKALIFLCENHIGSSPASCNATYGLTNFGAIWTQVLAYANVSGLDGQYICSTFSTSFCATPATSPLDITGYFPKPKPANAKAPPPSGHRVKVAHLSDIHLDARYAVGAEGSCSSGLCCRANNGNSSSPILPAPLYGTFKCDSPYYLVLAALRAIHPLTGTLRTSNSTLGWTIYTGDLVAHDPQPQLSRAYTEYTETSVYHLMQKYIRGPIFPVLGNHDSNPEAIDAPHSLPGNLGKQFSWNYNHVAALWQNDFELPATAAQEARLHYGGYSVINNFGLRIITLNTDFWYHSNFLNYINTTDPDNSGMLKWLIGELQNAEDKHERVWILGHVLTGWDGSNPLPDPTNLFYQIVERYSPHVIANIFFGHTHEDQAMIFYANNGTNRNNYKGLDDALTVGWIGPSITPLTNLNSGFRLYEVDTGNFEIYDAHTYYAQVDTFSTLDVNKTGPTFQLEYITRETYISEEWPSNAPLNATYWHVVTRAMEKNISIVETFNTYQGKLSVKSPVCNTTACQAAKICYIRSGSAPLGRECPQGYGSVQSSFDPSR